MICEKCGAELSNNSDDCLMCLVNEAEVNNQDKAKNNKKEQKKNKSKNQFDLSNKKSDKKSNNQETKSKEKPVTKVDNNNAPGFPYIRFVFLLVGVVLAGILTYTLITENRNMDNDPFESEFQGENTPDESEEPTREFTQEEVEDIITRAIESVYPENLDARVDIYFNDTVTIILYLQRDNDVDYDELNRQVIGVIQRSGLTVFNISTFNYEGIEPGAGLNVTLRVD